MIGTTYLERGEPVVVVKRWASHDAIRRGRAACGLPPIPPKQYPKRNVVIRRADGSLVSRPFRGLRRAS